MNLRYGHIVPASPGLEGLCQKPGAALKKAASSKISKYRDLSRREEATFDPLAIESYGAMGTQFKEWIDKVVEEAFKFGSCLCLSQSQAQQFKDEISVALQKGNAWIAIKASQICRTAYPDFLH